MKRGVELEYRRQAARPVGAGQQLLKTGATVAPLVSAQVGARHSERVEDDQGDGETVRVRAVGRARP
jgi:hypothetical protein